MRISRTATTWTVIIAIVLLWIVVFTHVDIATLVERIGTRNGYLIALLVALLGGLSAFTTASFFSTIGILSIGGLSPLILGLVTAPALALGDYVFYYLGLKGKTAMSPKMQNRVFRMETWFSKRPSFLILLGVYAYTAFAPFPAEVLMFSLAFLGYPFKKAFPVILLGHITIVTWLGYLAIATGPSLGL